MDDININSIIKGSGYLDMSDTDKIQKRYNRIAPIYDKIEVMMEKGKMRTWRENLWKRVVENLPQDNGRLLEAGVGTGKNIPYYPDGIEAYAIDFSKNMLEKARVRAEKAGRDITLRQMDIQQLDFLDNYFDIIVTSCVFCSVPDPVKGLKELKRVCKDNGKIIMLEHMRSEKEPVGKMMDLFNWVPLYTYGANINRRTMENIEKAGLKVVEVSNLMMDIVKEIILEP